MQLDPAQLGTLYESVPGPTLKRTIMQLITVDNERTGCAIVRAMQDRFPYPLVGFYAAPDRARPGRWALRLRVTPHNWEGSYLTLDDLAQMIGYAARIRSRLIKGRAH